MICIWTKLECNDHHDCTTTYTDKMQIDSRDQCEKIGYLHYKLLLQFSFTPKTFVMTMRHRVGEIGKNFDSRPVILDLVLSPSWWCHVREMCWELGFLKWRWPFSAWNHNKQVTSTITNSWHEKAHIDDRRWRQKNIKLWLSNTVLREIFFFHSTYFVVVPDFNFFILRFFARAYFDKYTEEEEGLVTQWKTSSKTENFLSFCPQFLHFLWGASAY